MRTLWLSVICSMMALVGTAQGREVKDVQMPRATIPNDRAELYVDQKSWQKLQNTYSLEDVLCTGSEAMLLPVSGACPDYPGYVTGGFAICTQTYEVPQTFTYQEVVEGWIRLVCTLDFANAVPVGEPTCDYSRCLYVEEPEFPSSGFPSR